MASFRLITLGALRLIDPVGRDAGHSQRKLLALLAYLARRAPRSSTRDELATAMWGERPEENARASLRQALFQLKRILGDLLDVTPESVLLRMERLDFDAASFEADVVAGAFRDAALRWNGEFLQGAEDAGGAAFRVWLESERARLRRLLSRALEALTSEAAARGAWVEAVTWAERWADALPLEERPHQRLVELLLFADRPLEALARHAAFVARVRSEFGTAPSDEFIRLGKQLERHARGGTVRLPAKPGDAESHVVHAPEMVGRGAAFAQLTSAWHETRRGRATVIIVEGDPGVGKTRLAEEFLRTVQPREPTFVVLRARAYDADRDVGLALARELLAPLRDAPGLLGSPRSALAELARLVPSVGEQIRDLPGPSDYRRALDEAIARILADVSDEAPIVIFADDLPRTDAESRRFVLSLARRLDRDARVLMILTARSGELGQSDELHDLRGLHRVRLESLELSEVEALVSSMLSLSADGRGRIAERLATECGGIPARVVEKVTAMVDDGQLVQNASGVWELATAAGTQPPARGDFISRTLGGRYTIERILSKGEVLTTYAAYEARNGRQLALHVPNRRVAAPAEADHFMRTFERVAALEHPTIVPVADYGAIGGLLFFATASMDAPSLRDRVAQERSLSVQEAIRIAIDVARALDHAHARGVYHRDLRPKHVLFTPTGTLLGRLGLADALSGGSGPDGEGPDDTGVLIGAPAYLSPEQLAGETADGSQNDIYSLGTLLFEMLTGEPPFGSRGRGLIARKLTETAPPVRGIRADVPEHVDQLVCKCLARMPAERYASVGEVIDALERTEACGLRPAGYKTSGRFYPVE